MVDGHPLDGISATRAGREGAAAVLGQVPALRKLPRQEGRAGPALLHALPYVEGLTIAEATNELAFVATGAYGKPLAKVQGPPVRLAIPWKYGFKSAKSFVKISFVDQRPATFWQTLGPDEYGFWANVNPDVPHPRWSQAKETFLTTGELRPTLLFNGYGDEVAGLYKGLENEPLYM